MMIIFFSDGARVKRIRFRQPGFVFVNLNIIGKDAIAQGVRVSCTLVVVLAEETCRPEWCRLE